MAEKERKRERERWVRKSEVQRETELVWRKTGCGCVCVRDREI